MAANNCNSVYQDILLENVEDGACVQLCGQESRITTNKNTEISCNPSASRKVTFKNVTKFEWELQYYYGSLLSVTDKFLAYSLKGRLSNSVRVINCQNTSNRILLKGFTGVVTDVAFSHAKSNRLAAVDDVGNLLVWELEEVNYKIEAKLKLHLLGDVEVTDQPTNHRIAWIPHEEGSNEKEPLDLGFAGIMTLFYNDVAEVWDINFASELAEEYDAPKLVRPQLRRAYITVKHDETGSITDCEMSPFGNVLAIASSDGFVKFWQIQLDSKEEPVCLHQWLPHDGKSVSAAKFCDDLKQEEPRIFWRFLLTACEKNTELKMWCAVTWNCLQVIKFQTPGPDLPTPEMNLVLLRTANFLVLTDIHRKVLYVMQIEASLKTEKAAVVSMAHYAMTLPILSTGFVAVERSKFNPTTLMEDTSKDSVIDYFSYDDDSKTETIDSSNDVDGYSVKLLIIQRRSMQNVDVCYIPDDLESDSFNTKSQDSSLLKNPASGQESLLLENDVAVSTATSISKLNQGETSNNFLGAGDGVSSSLKASPHLPTQEQGDSFIRPRISSQDKILHPIQVSTPNDSTNHDVASISSHPTTPILLTPDAFKEASKHIPNRLESLGSTKAATTSSKSGEISQPPKSDESRDPLSVLFAKPSAEEAILSTHLATKAPPSSPAVSREEEVQPSIDVAELLKSIQSKSSVAKSPDLISSAAAASDDTKQDVQLPVTLSAPPGLSRPINADSSFSGIHSPNVFSSLFLSSPNNPWPKAPDVTMSHLLPGSTSSQPQFITPVVVTSASSAPLIQPPLSADVMQLTNMPVPPDSDHPVFKSFTKFQKQQEEVLQSQRETLDSISKKQTQLQKQFDASQKHSQQHGERLDKAMTSLTEGQLQLSSDVKDGRQTLGTSSKVDQAVKAEFKRSVLPGVTSGIDEMCDKISSALAKQLAVTNSVMKDTISNSVKSKELVDKVALEMSKILQERIQSILPDILFRTVVPAFERSCQSMFQQLASTYHRGMDENLKQVEKQMQFRLKSEYEKLQQVTKEANATLRQLENATRQTQTEYRKMQQQITRNTEELLKRFEDRMSNRVLNSLKQNDVEQSEKRKAMIKAVESSVSRILDEKLAEPSISPGIVSPSTAQAQSRIGPLLRQSSVASLQEQILKLLQQGDINAGFEKALQASDLNLVLFACETTDPRMIFSVKPCPLTQPTLLSLIQQLSCDLANKTEHKLKYLQEAVMNLNQSDELTKKYLPSVMNTLITNLNSATSDPSLPFRKQLRMLSMAAQSLKG